MPNTVKYCELKVPEEFIKILSKSGVGKNIDDKLRIALAIELFIEKLITLEKAAELSNYPLANFIEILVAKGIPWMEYKEEHIIEDDIAITKYFEQVGTPNE